MCERESECEREGKGEREHTLYMYYTSGEKTGERRREKWIDVHVVFISTDKI